MNPGRRRLRLTLGLIFLLLVLVFLGYQVRHNAEFQTFDWSRFLAAFAGARKGYLAAAILAVYLTYVLRTWRWQCFYQPAKPLRFAPVLSATIMGFSTIMLLGRAGEIVRPVMIARKETVPLSAMMAVWAVERIFDTLTLMVTLALVLVFSPATLFASLTSPHAVHIVRQAGLAAMAVSVAGTALLLLYRARPEYLRRLGRWLHQMLPQAWQGGADRALGSFEEGLKFLRDRRSLLASAVISILLWTVVCTAYWCICQSLGGEMARLPATGMVILVFFAMVGSAVQVPGVGGGLQAATFIALTGLYNVEVELAATAAILLWVISFCVVLVAGLPLLVYEGWSFAQIVRIARENEANGALVDRENAAARIGTAP